MIVFVLGQPQILVLSQPCQEGDHWQILTNLIHQILDICIHIWLDCLFIKLIFVTKSTWMTTQPLAFPGLVKLGKRDRVLKEVLTFTVVCAHFDASCYRFSTHSWRSEKFLSPIFRPGNTNIFSSGWKKSIYLRMHNDNTNVNPKLCWAVHKEYHVACWQV